MPHFCVYLHLLFSRKFHNLIINKTVSITKLIILQDFHPSTYQKFIHQSSTNANLKEHKVGNVQISHSDKNFTLQQLPLPEHLTSHLPTNAGNVLKEAGYLYRYRLLDYSSSLWNSTGGGPYTSGWRPIHVNCEIAEVVVDVAQVVHGLRRQVTQTL